MRYLLPILTLAISLAAPAADKPRIIATTDGEIDDRCSMVRFLVYANEWDIAGIVYCSSRFHWKGHKWAGEDWIERDIDLYAASYDNLTQHAPDFPAPDELRKLIWVGNIDNVGEMGTDTPGSDRIAAVLLDADPRPVYLQAWGGTNTIARALWKIEHEYPDQMERVSKKAVIYIILDQDLTFREYIFHHWPDVQVLASFQQFRTIAYGWQNFIPKPLHRWFDGPWMKENILAGHGPLHARYEAHDDNRFRSEGDSPAFMHQIDVGLRSLEHPSYGGWGGRFVPQPGARNVWKGAEDDEDLGKPIYRFAEAFQNDWAARADWCVKPRAGANHPPVANLAHPLNITAKRNDEIHLSAAGSSDPDGHRLTYRWWQYTQADSYTGKVTIRDSNKRDAVLEVPRAHPGQTIHIICEVTDDGSPPLTRYQRVIVTVF
ncbi:MAG: DUF1593 domain-containing protein [bacterium]|nr:DUF1593 domain-containing protein [bacterium]